MSEYKGQITLINVNDGSGEGVSFYTWIKYADDGEGGNMSSSPEGKTYIGIAYNKTSPMPSDNPRDYTWSLFVGPQGAQGPQGEQGPQGPQGPSGDGASVYELYTNQEEILKFLVGDEVEYSPDILKLYISVPGESERLDLNKSGLKIELCSNGNRYIYNTQEDTSIEWDGLNKEITINVSRLINSFNEQFSGQADREFVLLFTYQKDEVYVQKALACRFGMNKDMAQLSIQASGIVQSIQGSKLVFNANGLTIQNGSFKIVDDGGNKLLHSDNGNLEITGTINAKSGEIGGLVIEDNYLYSGKNRDDSPLLINGLTGEIKADLITLGSGAQIDSSITLGNAKIANPSNNNGVFIQASDTYPEGDAPTVTLQMFDTGKAVFGKGNQSITIDPNDSEYGTAIILKGEHTSIRGKGFSITPNYANFSNITCSGKITTVAFEKNRVSSVGGSMIFKQRYNVIKVDTDPEDEEVITLFVENGFGSESSQEIKDGDILWLLNTDGAVIEKCQVTGTPDYAGKKLKCQSDTEDEIASFILIGSQEEVVIGINAGDSAILGGLYSRGLTITSQKNIEANEPNLFLGDLSSLDRTDVSGYGLYSSNVFLKGSLTTQSNTGTYAGVNTLSGVPATVFENDKSNVIFWAGARGANSENIQNAPFQVTESGSLYAQKAYITDSIFTGKIDASELHAVKLYGKGEEDIPALTIYGDKSTKGISFVTVSGSELFSVRSDGFYKGETSFISVSENGVEAKVKSIKADEIETNVIKPTSGALTAKDGEKVIFKASNTETILSGLVKYSSGNYGMEYRPILVESNLIGYDLYIVAGEGGNN